MSERRIPREGERFHWRPLGLAGEAGYGCEYVCLGHERHGPTDVLRVVGRPVDSVAGKVILSTLGREFRVAGRLEAGGGRLEEQQRETSDESRIYRGVEQSGSSGGS